jgi:hypothetical protein
MNNPCRKGTFSEKLFDLMIKAKSLGERKPVEISFYEGAPSKYSIAVNKLASRYCPYDHFSAEKKGETMTVIYYGAKEHIAKPSRNTGKNYIYKLMDYVIKQPTKEVVVREVRSRNDNNYSHSSVITALKSLSVHFPTYDFYTRTCPQSKLLIIGCKDKELMI